MTRKHPEKRTAAPSPYDGSARTVDDLLARLEAIQQEADAILSELRRQRNRADDAIRRALP